MSDGGRGLRSAILVALEPLNLGEWLTDDEKRDALRSYAIGWVTDYAERKGVIFGGDEIATEVDAVIAGIEASR